MFWKSLKAVYFQRYWDDPMEPVQSQLRAIQKSRNAEEGRDLAKNLQGGGVLMKRLELLPQKLFYGF